jgi:F-type H+-transporting ATPase subunit gamma
MPSTRDIRRRIKSVKNTAQITKAMQMVAASKMRRAQQSALSGRPYADLMNQVLAQVTSKATDFSHPLMEKREGGKTAVVLVSSDKGLCGGLNTNLLRDAAKYDRETTVFVCAGRKAAQYVSRTGRNLAGEFTFSDKPEFSEARSVSKFAQNLFLKGEVNRVEVLFTNFVSTLTQHPDSRSMLPVGKISAVESDLSGDDSPKALSEENLDFSFEPEPSGVLGALLPHYLNFVIYQLFLESKASEHSARMVAMKSATDNARDIIKGLTLDYNKIRQANITKELLEITGAAMAMG